jgi:hypothetical protein
MTTRAIMLAEIQADTGRTATAQVTAMTAKINAAIRHYQPKHFWFNETRAATFNTVVGTDVYTFNTATTTGTIPYEFYRIDGVWMTFAAGDVRELDVEDYAVLEAEADSQTANNQPTAYGYINRALRFDYPPDAIYATRIAGHLKLAAPASDAETDNPWMTEAYDLIMSRAKAELYAHKWEDPANAAIMVQAESSALKILQDATADKVRTGYVHPASDF